jgi:mycothiol synthase
MHDDPRTVRAPRWDDLDEVLALLNAADLADTGSGDWTEDVLRRHWGELDLEHEAWVVELDGRAAAFAWLDDRGAGRLIVEGFVHPELRGRGVGTTLLEVTETYARRRAESIPPGPRVFLQNATVVGDECTPKLYARHGYHPARYQLQMSIVLDSPPTAPALPGIELRPYREPDERRALHAVLQDAFATGPYHRRAGYEEWAARVLEREGFDPSLVWVAVEGEEVVGANVCGWKEAGDFGWVGSLGVLPSHRGRGIAGALLTTAFAEFQARGERRVALMVDADNPSASRLYERAGMRVLFTIVLFEKELRPAAGASERT